VIALATGTVSVLRGSSTTVFGDEADVGTVVAVGVPFAIMPASQRSTRSVDARPQEVEYFRGRGPAGTDVRVGDQLRDEVSLALYIVTGSHQAANPILRQDLAVDLTRVPTA
jgi:NADPH-dependent glutamate synthase beta subunit-like oxidoreductase